MSKPLQKAKVLWFLSCLYSGALFCFCLPSFHVPIILAEETETVVQGIEMETRIDIINDNYIFVNYTFQCPEDDDGNELPFVAQHKGNSGVNVHYRGYINTNLSAFVSGRRFGEDGDLRDNPPAYALLNLSVITFDK